MHIGITGATGKIGRHLVKAVLDRGHSVKAMIRTTRSGKRGNTQNAVDEILSWGATTCPADFADPASLQNFCSGLDVVIHNGYWQGNELHEPITWLENNLMGSIHLMDALKNSGGTQFIFISSSDAYGRGPDNERTTYNQSHPITSYTATNPRNVYSSYKLAVESIVTGYKYDQKMSGNSNLRPAGPLGLFGYRCYDSEGMFTQEITDALSGIAATLKLPSNFSIIDGYDIGRACVALIAQAQKEEPTVEDVCLYANTPTTPAIVKAIIEEFFGDIPLTVVEEASEFIYKGDEITASTSEYNSEATLRRHLMDLKSKSSRLTTAWE